MMFIEPWINKNQPEISALWQALRRPVHGEVLRDATAAAGTNELDCGNGMELCLEGWNGGLELGLLRQDFEDFLSQSMQVKVGKGGIVIKAVKTQVEGSGIEKCRTVTTSSGCVIEAEDVAGLRRALFNLEDEMTIRRFPALPFGEYKDFTNERVRISRSPLASYRFGSGWELNHPENFYPDEYLNALAHCSINAIWVAGAFREIIKSKVLPELTANADERALAKLADLARRAANYGIKVFLFCMEPRALASDHPFWKTYPELAGTRIGHDNNSLTTLCFRQPPVQEYLRECLNRLWNNVPELGGLIQIFAGERATSCRSIDNYLCSDSKICQTCSTVPQGEALVELINFQSKIIHEISPDATYLVWSYGLPNHATATKQYIYDHIDPRVIWVENFEHNSSRRFFGREIINEEYSLTVQGPSPSFLEMREKQRPESAPIWPKFQFGTTYEFATLPFMPVPSRIYHKQMHSSGCGGAIVSWIIGGWPDMMLKAYGLTTSAETLTESEFLKKLAGFYYGPDFADEAAEIWHEFGNILEGFPCDNNVFYYGPLPRCPGYQLHLTGNSQLPLYNYNWGLDRSRNLQPYYCSADKRWAGQFEPAELIKVFRQLGSAWDKACKRLAAIPATTAETKRQAAVAEALGIIMQSAANIYEFYLLREHCKEPQMAGRLCEIARQEIRLVNRMEQLLAMDCRIGFHSEIYYYVLSPQLLRDKTANCEKIIRTLETNNLYKVKEGEYVNSM